MHNIYKASVSPGAIQQIMSILLTPRYTGNSDTLNGRTLDRRQV
jgi:hypothetical protein